jgi:hypothetical protein
MNNHGERDEQALKISYKEKFGGRERGWGVPRGWGSGKERQPFHKITIECYKCHKPGDFQYKFPSWEKKVLIMLSLINNKRCC